MSIFVYLVRNPYNDFLFLLIQPVTLVWDAGIEGRQGGNVFSDIRHVPIYVGTVNREKEQNSGCKTYIQHCHLNAH